MDLGRKSKKLRVLEEVQENYANGFMESAMPRLLSDTAGAEWERWERKWPKIVTKRLMAKFMATNRIHVCNMEQRMGTILGENERNWSPS